MEAARTRAPANAAASRKSGTSHHQEVACLPMALTLPQRRDFGRSSWQLADRFNRRLVKHTTLAGLPEGCIARITLALTARLMSDPKWSIWKHSLALRI
jgi:hypothetical protein